MKVTIFTRFWMCCVLFAASVVNSLAADRLVIIGDAVWGGWSISDGIIMSSTSNDVWKATTHLEAFIYSPDKLKRNLMRQMEASLYTLRLPNESLIDEIVISGNIPEEKIDTTSRVK
jgi:hypothetical protein